MTKICYVNLRQARMGLMVFVFLMAALAAQIARADIADFVGTFAGSAEMAMADGSTQQRDLNVQITQTKTGFRVGWTTVTYRPDGTTKAKSYEVDFVPTDRDGVYAAAQKKNVFGHEVQLDPMKGEPYVWARIVGDMMTVYSLFVDGDGGYEIQQFDRKLAEGGLTLDFNRLRNGEKQRTVSTFLTRQ